MQSREIVYTPVGVCSKLMMVELNEKNVIENVRIIGGCNGNTQGLCALLKGMDADEAIRRLEGIDCGGKGTSCPDQMSKALKQARVKNS